MKKDSYELNKKNLNEAQSILSRAKFDVEYDKVIVSGGIDALSGQYCWALNFFVSNAIKDKDFVITDNHGDKRTNKISVSFRQKDNVLGEAFLSEDDAEEIEMKINNLRKMMWN